VKSKTGFQLPPDVSFEKQRLSNAWAYVFRHRLLGEIGRILLQELDDGRCHISCEVVGDPSDPMTTQRAAIFKPLGLELTRQMEAVMGRTREDAGSVDLPPRPPETKEVIESKRIPCERCGTVVAMLNKTNRQPRVLSSILDASHALTVRSHTKAAGYKCTLQLFSI
jgi:hypothetical protein